MIFNLIFDFSFGFYTIRNQSNFENIKMCTLSNSKYIYQALNEIVNFFFLLFLSSFILRPLTQSILLIEGIMETISQHCFNVAFYLPSFSNMISFSLKLLVSVDTSDMFPFSMFCRSSSFLLLTSKLSNNIFVSSCLVTGDVGCDVLCCFFFG